MDPLTIGLITAGITAAVGAYQNSRNRKAQEKQNAFDRGFQQSQYDQQRQDALDDFARANAYNDPIQQMTRLRQAGLNPNLVYGKGADTTAVTIRGAQSTPSTQPAPKDDFSWATNSLAQGMDAATKALTQDNVAQQTALMKEQARLANTQELKTSTDVDMTKLDYETKKEMQDNIVMQVELQNEKLKAETAKVQADTTFTIDENERKKLANTENVQLTTEQILTERLKQAKTEAETQQIQQMIKVAQNEELIKKFEVELNQTNSSKSDPWYWRQFMWMIEQAAKLTK